MSEHRIVIDREAGRVGVTLPNCGIVAGNRLADIVLWLGPNDPDDPAIKTARYVCDGLNLYRRVVDGCTTTNTCEMTLSAWENGLPHWRCTSPDSNREWRRSDGLRHEFTGRKRLWDELRDVDAKTPMGSVPGEDSSR